MVIQSIRSHQSLSTVQWQYKRIVGAHCTREIRDVLAATTTTTVVVPVAAVACCSSGGDDDDDDDDDDNKPEEA